MPAYRVAIASEVQVRPVGIVMRGGFALGGGSPFTQTESVISDATRSALVFHVPGAYTWLIPIQGDATLLTVTVQMWRGPDVVVRPTASLLGPAGAKASTTMPNTFSTWETVQVAIPIKGSGLVCFTVERPNLQVAPYIDCGNIGGWVGQYLPVTGVLQDRTLRANNRRRIEVRFPTSGAVVFT